MLSELKNYSIDNQEDSSGINSLLGNLMVKYWGLRSTSYSEQNMSQLFSDSRAKWEDFIFKKLENNKTLNILDIGTGPGFFAIISAFRGHSVTAVDVSEDMLNKAIINSKLAGVKIKFMKVGDTLPFKDETFDVILSRDVTWTLLEPEKQLMNWASKLKKGGRMLYFDSEWYYYLRNKELKRKWEVKKKEIEGRGGFTYRDAKKLEVIASKLPMTYIKRPLWDAEFWHKQKEFECYIETGLNPYIYNNKEQMQYECFPEFLVDVRRSKDE